MSRLIDADEFKRINKRLLHCDFPYLSEMTLEELLDEIPTADVVSVVRCKDCSRQCICYHSADYYCADGEKVTE